jgi:hypothetical protein
MLNLELQGFTIGLQCKVMWYLPLLVVSWLLLGKCHIWILVGKSLMDLLGSWSNGIQSCPHCFNGVVSCVWSILTHADFFICMLCLLFSIHLKRHSQTHRFFFGAWRFKLTIISLFINVPLTSIIKQKITQKWKKIYVLQNAPCFKLNILTLIPKH